MLWNLNRLSTLFRGPAQAMNILVLLRRNGNALTPAPTTFYNQVMEVNIPPNLQAKLDRIAQKQGCAPESIVSDAVERLVEYDEWFVRQVEKGLAQLERGELLEHEEVVSRMENIIRDKQH
jgi:predicted transcriptional regulator